MSEYSVAACESFASSKYNRRLNAAIHSSFVLESVEARDLFYQRRAGYATRHLLQLDENAGNDPGVDAENVLDQTASDQSTIHHASQLAKG